MMINWRHIILLGMVCGMPAVAVPATATADWVSGTVYLDADRDNRRGETEPGLPGVLVSNGEEVVPTDGHGRYHLPVRPRSAIFVIKPPGYALPRGAHNLPHFHFLHWPEGSGEDLRYGGVPPTGDLPDEVDFALLPGVAADAFSILVVADPQVHNPTHVEYYGRRFVDELSGRDDFAFGVMLGDIVRNDLSLFEHYLPVNARLPGPIFHVVGNHDIDYDATELTTAVATFQRHLGPANYALMEGAAVFIVINNVVTPLPGAEVAGGNYTGGLTPAADAFVGNLLRHVPEHRLIVMCQHIPLVAGIDRPTSHRPEDQARLLDHLRGRKVLVMAGHTHTQWHAFLGEDSGWRGDEPLRQWVVGTASGSWWGGEPGPDGLPDSTMKDGTPPGYGILHVQGTDYRLDYRVPGEAPEHQFRVMMPRHVVAGERDQSILVNVFNGSERTRVDYRVSPGDRWRALTHTPGVDYDYVGRIARRNASQVPSPGTHLPPPGLSTHLWAGRLPRSLDPGDHRIEFRVTDEWGAQFHAVHPLTVRPATLPYGRN